MALAPFAYWGAELKLLTGERGRLKVIGTPKGITAQRVRVVRGVSVVRGALSAKTLITLNIP